MSTSLRNKLKRQEEHRVQKEKRARDTFLASIKKTEGFKVYSPKHSVFCREIKSYPSFSGEMPGCYMAAKPERKEYSGDYIVGIATMHKSNAVPVGRDDNPTDYSTMRRN